MTALIEKDFLCCIEKTGFPFKQGQPVFFFPCSLWHTPVHGIILRVYDTSKYISLGIKKMPGPCYVLKNTKDTKDRTDRTGIRDIKYIKRRRV